jgi:hypothetical protein
MWARLRDPERYYSNPNKQSKFRVWIMLIHRHHKPNFGHELDGSMVRYRLPGEWIPGRSPHVAPLNVPTRSLEWNTDPAVHAEWYTHKFPRTPPLYYSLSLPTEVSTSGFMWRRGSTGDPLIDYIDVGRWPWVIQVKRFENLGTSSHLSNIFGRCRHWLIVRLGESDTPLGNINVRIPIFSCCQNSWCHYAWVHFRWECCPCEVPH